MAINGTPTVIVEPEKPFDKLAVSLHIEPIFQRDQVTAKCEMSAVRYRQLESGQPERLDGSVITELHEDVFADASTDLALAVALMKINAAIQEFIVSRGY